MDAFDPLSDFYDLRAAIRYEMTVTLPEVNIIPFQLKPYMDHFGYPAPTFLASIRKNEQSAGEVCFGFNPLGDRLYIYRLVVKTEHQRQHLGLATLWHLHLQHRLPITPIGAPHPFWRSARRVLGRTGAQITAELHYQALQAEAERWQNLAPDLYPPSSQPIVAMARSSRKT